MPFNLRDNRGIKSAQRWRDPEYWPFAITGEMVTTELPPTGEIWHETFDNWKPDDSSAMFHETFDNQLGAAEEDWHEGFDDYHPVTVGPITARYLYTVCISDGHGGYYTEDRERVISVSVTLKQADGTIVWSDTTPASFSEAPTSFGNPWTLTVPTTYSVDGTPIESFLGLPGNIRTINFDPSTHISGEAIYNARPYFAGCP